MIFSAGTVIKCRETGAAFIITESNARITSYHNGKFGGRCVTDYLPDEFVISGMRLPELDDILTHMLVNTPFTAPLDAVKVLVTGEEYRGFIKIKTALEMYQAIQDGADATRMLQSAKFVQIAIEG